MVRVIKVRYYGVWGFWAVLLVAEKFCSTADFERLEPAPLYVSHITERYIVILSVLISLFGQRLDWK